MIDYIMPRRCYLCGEALGANEKCLCQSCLQTLPRTRYQTIGFNPMEQRFAGQFPLERAIANFFYTRGSSLSTLVMDMKYRRFRTLARELGAITARETWGCGFFDGMDMIVPVPMHWLKKARRGYNQAEEIARGVSSETGLPVVNGLRARRPHKTQTGFSGEARQKNVVGIFDVPDPKLLEGRGIVLLDDICTTGATLREAALALTAAAPTARLRLLTLGVTF